MRRNSLNPLFIFFLPLLWVFPAFAQTLPPLYEVKQGEVVFLTLPSKQNVPLLKGQFLGKKITLDPLNESGKFGALIGVDLNETPADHLLTDAESQETLATVHILPNEFGRQEVKVPPKFVNPSRRQLDRIKKEGREIHALLRPVSEERYWRGNFIIPVTGTPMGTFGLRRVFNGEPRNPHSGEDIAAPEKTPVYAPNDGVVAGVVDHFFSGKGIIIDHGRGLFTEYFHLFKAEVKKGQKIKKGEEIGLVGKTGRATGPHLHWGMVINGAKVNPLSVVRLKLE